MFGDTDFVGMYGRKFGDMANESVLFGAKGEVVNRAGKSGDADNGMDVEISCAVVRGHVALAPSSTWS
jgi:hypothetical protein